MNRKVIELTKELVSISSHEREAEVAQFLTKYLEDLSFEVVLEEVEPGRPNLIGLFRSSTPGRTLMFCGHMDTVPPVYLDQLRPRVEGGKLYGRGACDMKGGLAAMVCAMESLVKDGRPPGTLMLLATMGEETGSQGMLHFMEHSRERYAPSGCIVGEPTSLEVVIAHKGEAQLSVSTIGKAAHGSTPDLGVNAIYHMALVVKAIQEELASTLSKKPHPFLGSGTVNVGVIQGGERTNMVPQRCSIEVDRRFLPGESPRQVEEELEALIKALKRDHPELTAEISLKHSHPPFEIDEREAIVQAVKGASQAVLERSPAVVGLSYCTDGALTQAGGIPTVICGPGSPTQAHTEAEFTPVEELVAAVQIYREAALKFFSS